MRRMAVEIVHASGTLGTYLAPKHGPWADNKKPFYPHEFYPATFKYTSARSATPGSPRCSTKGDQVSRTWPLPGVQGGLSTPHTPHAVAYYLDQAQRCGPPTRTARDLHVAGRWNS